MNTKVRIQNKFKKVYRELEHLEQKVHKKSGFLFFESHIYTIEELLNSPHHHKIFSITEKIGADIKSWYHSGKLTSEEENVYYFERDKTEDELDRINTNIEYREPTWWEEVKGTFIEFTQRVLDNLPEELKRNLLESFKARAFQTLLLPFLKKMPKLSILKR